MPRLYEWSVDLGSGQRDASLEKFLAGTRREVDLSTRIRALQAQLVQSKEYASHQGATVTPRPLWVVDVQTVTRQSAQGAEEVVPLLEEHVVQVRSSDRASRVVGQGKRKEVWRGISLKGGAHTHHLFGLVTSRYVGKFSILHRDLAYLPLIAVNGGFRVNHSLASRGRAQKTLEAESADESALHGWVRSAQARWEKGRKADQQELVTERLDYQHGLQSQPACSPRVVHTRSGNMYAALLRPGCEASTGVKLDKLTVKFRRGGRAVSSSERNLGGVVVDNLLHWIEVRTVQEGYWLVGIMNSPPFISALGKEVQNRDFYSAPSRLLVSLGLRFDARNPTHVAIAEKAKMLEGFMAIYDRRVLEEELGSDQFALVDDTDASPEIPRMKWSFDKLREENMECGQAYDRLSSLVAKLIA